MLRVQKLDLLSSLTLALCSCLLGIFFRSWNFDDGEIVYRLVRNLITHGEWAYNLGESFNPSTSALNTILIAILAFLGIPIPLAAHILGTLALLALSLCVYFCLRPTLSSWGALGVSALCLWVLGNSSCWGLETFLFLSLLSWISLLIKSGKEPWFALGLLVLARPDGIVVAGMYGAWFLFKRRQVPWSGTAIFLTVLLPWIAFSMYSFGQPFPDTLSVKMWQGRSGLWGQGWIYAKGLGKHMESSSDALVNFFALCALFGIGPVFRAFPLLFLFTIFQQITYSLLNVPFYHWYAISLDLCRWLLAAFFIVFLLQAVLRKIALSKEKYITILIALICISIFGNLALKTPVVDARDDGYRLASSKVKELRPEVRSVAAVEVGTIGYELPYTILDLAGLASKNPELVSGVHTDYFFDHLPDVVLLHAPHWHFETAIADDARFDATYELIHQTTHHAFPMEIFAKRALSKSERISDFVARSFPKMTKLDLAAAPQSDGVSVCIFDRVNGRPTQPGLSLDAKPLLLAVSGWSALQGIDSPLGPLEVVLVAENSNSAYSITQTERLSRVDVAKHLSLNNQSNSGFALKAAITDIPPGKYSLWTKQKSPAGSEHWCGPVVTIQISTTP